MAVDDVYQLDALYSVEGEKCANVFHFRVNAEPANTPEVSLANAFKVAVWDGGLNDCMTTSCILQTIRVRKVWPAPGGPIIVVVNSAGTVAGECFPPNSSANVSWYTPRFDKHGRGRTHFSGVPIGFAENGILAAVAVTAYNAVGNILYSLITGNGGNWNMGVWNRAAEEFEDVNRWFVRRQLHTMRGRRMAAP